MATKEGEGRAPGTLAALFQVMRDETLTPEQKLLWALYRSYENPAKGRPAWPGDELLAAHMGKAPRTVQRGRAELLRRKFLKQQLRGPHPANYRAVIPAPGEDPGPQSLAKDGGTSLAMNGETRREGSPKGSSEGSPSVSPLVSPEYGKGGEYGKNMRYPHAGIPTHAAPSAASAPLSPEVAVGTLGSDGKPVEHTERERFPAWRIVKAWVEKQPTRPPDKVIKKQGAVARRLSASCTPEQVVMAMVGIQQLFPHSDGEPWDLFDLEKKFAKAQAAAMNHPELKAKRRANELLEYLESREHQEPSSRPGEHAVADRGLTP